jgi:DNA-directed RNA polymerase specialized sigma subunit
MTTFSTTIVPFFIMAANVEPDNNLRLLYLYRLTGDIRYRNLIVLNNRLLLYKEAHRLCRTKEDFKDLYAEAVLGFIKGIDKYCLEKSKRGRRMKLTTYCVIWIRKFLYKYIDKEEFYPASPVHWRVAKKSSEIEKRIAAYEGDGLRKAYELLLDEKPSVRFSVMYSLNRRESKVDIACINNQEYAEDSKVSAYDIVMNCPFISEEDKQYVLNAYTNNQSTNSQKIQNIINKLRNYVKAHDYKRRI